MITVTEVLYCKQRERGKDEWSSVSRSAKPGADILISNLSPATWYQIKVIQSSKNSLHGVQVTGEAQKSSSEPSHTSLEFEIATLAADASGFSGDKVDPLLLFQGALSRLQKTLSPWYQLMDQPSPAGWMRIGQVFGGKR